MWHDVSDMINGYVIYPNQLSAAFRNDKENFAKAVKAINYFELQMEDDVLVKEIERIGAYEDFFDKTNPDDFFYKIDISKGNDVQLKTIVCISVLTIKSHPTITNYYRRIVSDDGEPVFQKYIAPITTPDKRNGDRLLYSYTTDSLFRLHAFFYLKNKHNYSGTAILNLLGYVNGNSDIVMDESKQKESSKRKNPSKSNDNIEIAELKVELMLTKMAMRNYFEAISDTFTEFEKNVFNSNKQARITNAKFKIEHADILINEATGRLTEQSLYKKSLLEKIDRLLNQYEALDKEIDELKTEELEYKLELERGQLQLDQLKTEAAAQAENLTKQNNSVSEVPSKQPGLLARLFGGKTAQDSHVSPQSPIEVKEYDSLIKTLQEQISVYNKQLLKTQTTIEKKQQQKMEVKSDIANHEKLLKDADALLKELEIKLATLPQEKELYEKDLEAIVLEQNEELPISSKLIELNNSFAKEINRSSQGAPSISVDDEEIPKDNKLLEKEKAVKSPVIIEADVISEEKN